MEVEMLWPGGAMVDLHARIAPAPFGWRVPAEELFAGPQAFSVGGMELPALAPEARMIHAACHAWLGGRPPRLVSLCDVAQLEDAVDLARVRAIARRWGLSAVLDRALAAAAARRMIRPQPTAGQGSWRDDAMIGLMASGRWHSLAKLLAARELPWRQWGPYLSAIVWPSREAAGAFGGRRAWLRRGVAKARGGSPLW